MKSLPETARFSGLLLLTFLALNLAGCGNGSNNGYLSGITSRTRVFNALQGCPANLDVRQTDGTTVQSLNPTVGVAFGTLTPYQLVTSGIGIRTNVYTVGGSTAITPEVQLTFNQHVTNNYSGTYTVVPTGACNGTGDAAPVLTYMFDDPITPPTDSIQANLRLANYASDSGSIFLFQTVTSGGQPVTTSIGNGTGTNTGIPLTGIPYKAHSVYVPVPLTPGQSITLTIRNAAGTTFTLPATLGNNILSGRSYTLLLYGQVNPAAGGQPLNAVLLQDEPISVDQPQ